MGCSCSRPLVESNSEPLNALQASITDPDMQKTRRRRQEEKRQRQLNKLQKRNGKIKRHARRGRTSGSLSRTNGSNWRRNSHVAMRLLGGSNGSTATECGSALYARTVEKQREDHHRIIEKKTLSQLHRQLETFLLNQLILGMQFFGHYEAEIAAIDQQLQDKRRASAHLQSEHSLLHASAIDLAVSRRILWKPIQGKSAGQPLQKPLTYVVFENVDIARPDDANYDSIAALCKVLMETDYYKSTPCSWSYVQVMERTRWMGYVRLKLRDQQQGINSTKSSPSACDETDGGIYTDGSSSSGYSTAGSWRDYDHIYIARLNTPRPLKELRIPGVALKRNVLPDGCICRLSMCLPSWLDDNDDDGDDDDEEDDDEDEDEDEDEEDNLDNDHDAVEEEEEAARLSSRSLTTTMPVDDQRSGYETVEVLRQCHLEQQHRRALLQQSYLSSTQFMNYFGELLRQQLAKDLHIPGDQLATGSYNGCTVSLEQELLIPAIHVPHGWPDCAFEFNRRARPLLTNLHTGEKFQWPTEQMRQRIKSFGFHLVPVGYSPKHRRNPFRELEWRIVFPLAEKYLERQLNQMQLKVLLLMKILVRTFVGEQCSSMGSLMEQLRAHLFWQCESHSNEWPEEFLGEQLVRFVRTFANCLARKELRDYFIKERNLFEHVPEDALMQLHSIMAGIAEHPLLHVVEALRHLQHHDDFYPTLEYKRLLENLFTGDYLQLQEWSKFKRQTSMVTPNTGNTWQASPEMKKKDSQNEKTNKRKEEVITDAQGWLGLAEHQERSRGKLRRKTQRMQAVQQMKLLEQRQRQLQQQESTCSVDSLDLQLLLSARRSNSNASNGIDQTSQPQFNNGLEILRRTNLLELLLDHLLNMLRKAIAFRNSHHSHLYLEQGQRLCRLYQQLGCSQHAQHYVEQLCEAANSLEEMDTTPLPLSSLFTSFEPAPCLPRRSASSPQHPRKSIKFDDHIVQIHAIPEYKSMEEDANEPSSSSSSSSSAAATAAAEAEAAAAAAEAEAAAPQTTTADDNLTSNPTLANSTTDSTILSLGKILQRLNVQPDKVETLTQKTDQLIQTLAPESRREEIFHIFKRNTEKLKEVLN